MVDTSPRLHLETAAHAGDLMSARHAFEQMQGLIALHPGYAPYAHYGPAVIELLRGNLELSLEHAERALELARPGEHPAWPWIESARLEALIGLGRFQAARREGQGALDQANEIGLGIMADHLAVPLAIAEAKLGQHARAAEQLDQVIAAREKLGSRGLNLGWAYEQRARVALWMGDRAAFVEAADGCAREYGKGRGVAAFAAKYEALCEEARHLGIGSPSELPPQITGSGVHTAADDEAGFGSAAFERRCAEALALLVRESGADGGTLYRSGERGELVRCASTADGDAPSDLQAQASNVLHAQGGDDATVALSSVALTEEAGVRWLPVTLGSYRHGRFRRTGVALLRFTNEPRVVSMEVIELVGRLLRSANLTTIA
jgi:tetratricopeptide (TPR) repeat protein